jgi:hypothetical protein
MYGVEIVCLFPADFSSAFITGSNMLTSCTSNSAKMGMEDREVVLIVTEGKG